MRRSWYAIMKMTGRYGESISPEMIGLFFEDINYAADGGLYAEMIENRSFEAREAHGTPGKFYAIDDPGYAWKPAAVNGEEPIMQYVTGTPLSEANPHYLRFTASAAGQGFSNQAYDGICLKKGEKYHVSFYARCVEYAGGYFTVSIQKDGKVCCSGQTAAIQPVPYLPFADLKQEFVPEYGDLPQKIARIKAMDTSHMCREHEWSYYTLTLTAEEDVRGASFTITLDAPGVVEFDLISMMPDSAEAGIFRKDLFDALLSLKPGFIRFPGGCIVEGISLENRYRWKQTVGPLKDRKYKPNLWAFDDDRDKTDLNTMRPTSAHYGQSYGLGFYEYFLLCELLGAKALPVIGIGAACQFRSTQMVDIDSTEFKEYVQDALDLIEFANGAPDTCWGNLRAQMGHPKPFGLEMLAIGNEQWETKNLDFYERHKRFEQAIHEVYPEIRLIGSAGPIIGLPTFGESWDFYRKGTANRKCFCHAVDEHYYMPHTWMYEHVDFYDKYPRDVAVFAGEYAAHTPQKENNMESALAEAAFLTGVEKNAGVVRLASYAPLFNRIGHSQWAPDMIWFDDADVYLTPNYYVQKLYANHLGDHTLEMDEETIALRKDGIYVSVSECLPDGDDASPERILKIVNAGEKDYTLPLADKNGQEIHTQAKAWILEASGEAAGNMPQPSHIREEEMAIDGSVCLKGKTFTVLRFRA